MSDDLSHDTITTAAEFESALGSLLAAAARNDVDPRGSWVYYNGNDSLRNWEIMVYELE